MLHEEAFDGYDHIAVGHEPAVILLAVFLFQGGDEAGDGEIDVFADLAVVEDDLVGEEVSQYCWGTAIEYIREKGITPLGHFASLLFQQGIWLSC
ncbi:hypothetical protein EGT74_23480 [Chitinophaga lutea]|uniref:Uncharacterized protein n=1 Tax=Chitinophaga lutea TaxID=2488634 RepID=A0A3N4Q0R4_9BACT|nr:hypothetical protein EGT74_23480 [Chitinophaga lutea]